MRKNLTPREIGTLCFLLQEEINNDKRALEKFTAFVEDEEKPADLRERYKDTVSVLEQKILEMTDLFDKLDGAAEVQV